MKVLNAIKLVRRIEECIRKWWEEEEKLSQYLGKLKVIAKSFDEELVKSQILGDESLEFISKSINVFVFKK